MPERDRFTFRISEEERQLLATLAENEQRTEADVLRLLIRRAHEEFIARKPNKKR